MTSRSKFAWAASLVVTALVVGAGTWFVIDRRQTEPLGERVSSTEPADAPTTPSWLFSATAAGGSYTEHPDGTATLTLTDADADVTGFTDRPDRDTVIIAAPKLVAAWPTLFADSAPNAVLVTRDQDGVASSFVLELTEPAIDGSTLTFAATQVEGKDHSSQLPGMTTAPTTPPPASFQTVSLFIDDASRGTGRDDSNDDKAAVAKHHSSDSGH